MLEVGVVSDFADGGGEVFEEGGFFEKGVRLSEWLT